MRSSMGEMVARCEGTWEGRGWEYNQFPHSTDESALFMILPPSLLLNLQRSSPSISYLI